LQDTTLSILSVSSELDSNNGWQGSSAKPVIATSGKTPAATIPPSTSLWRPGPITAQISGASGETGAALVEV
jgi:hypothetical protein